VTDKAGPTLRSFVERQERSPRRIGDNYFSSAHRTITSPLWSAFTSVAALLTDLPLRQLNLAVEVVLKTVDDLACLDLPAHVLLVVFSKSLSQLSGLRQRDYLLALLLTQDLIDDDQVASLPANDFIALVFSQADEFPSLAYLGFIEGDLEVDCGVLRDYRPHVVAEMADDNDGVFRKIRR
jgi:hypothetical protein